MSKHPVTVFVVIDENGDAVADVDREAALTRYQDDVSSSGETICRCIKIKLAVDLPEDVELADEAPLHGSAELAEITDGDKEAGQ